MNGRHHHHHHQTPTDELAVLLTSIAHLTPSESRKAKLLFLRNELSTMRARQQSLRGLGPFGCLTLIPVFWPMAWLARRGGSLELQAQRERFMNALGVWRDDLGDDADALEGELQRILPSA
jgi:hypothetical protein